MAGVTRARLPRNGDCPTVELVIAGANDQPPRGHTLGKIVLKP